jgi:hypothetical protein
MMNWLYGEPRLADVLADPIVHAVMARDGVKRQFLVDLLGAASRRLAAISVQNLVASQIASREPVLITALNASYPGVASAP